MSEDIRPQGAWYSVYLNNPYHAKPCVDVNKLAELLPHGSGIDGDWHIQVRRNGDICVHGEYHAMDEHGYYDGWRSFRFTIERARKLETHALRGPCESKTQILARPGDIRMVRWVGAGEHADYLYDVCNSAISELLAHRNEVI